MVRTKVKVNKLYRRLYALFLIILFPAVMLGAYLYFYAQNTSIHTAREIIQASVQSAADSIDGFYENVAITNEILIKNQEISELSLSDQQVRQKLVQVKAVNLLLEKMVVLSPLLTDIALYTGEDKCITSFGIFPCEYYFEQLYCYAGYDITVWKERLGKHVSFYNLPFTTLTTAKTAGIQVKIVVPVITVFPVAKGRGLLLYTVSVDKIKQILANHMPYEGALFTLSDAENRVVFQPEMSQSGETLLAQTAVSAITGWRYTVSVPQSSVLAHNTAGPLYILLFISASILFGLILTHFSTNRVYKPLHSISKQITPLEDDASVQGLNALEKQVENMVRRSLSIACNLESVSRSYAEAVILSPSMNNKRADTLIHILKTRFGFHGAAYRCTVFQCMDMEAAFEEASNYFQTFYPCLHIRYSENTLLLVFEVTLKHTREQVERCMDAFVAIPSACISSAVISDEMLDFKEIQQALSSALTVLQHSAANDEARVVFVEDYDILSNYKFTYRDEMQLVEAVQSGKREEAHCLIDSVLLENYERHVSIRQITNLIREMNSLCIRYGLQENIHLDPWEEGQRLLPFEVQRAHLHAQLNILFAGIKKKPSDSHSEAVKKADQIIFANYAQDIFLESVAQALNLSAKHLSKIYKQENGINLSNQIAMVRVRKARDLLETSEMNVTIVMEKTGFTNRATFIRTFKKYAGLTPSAYRELHKNGTQ